MIITGQIKLKEQIEARLDDAKKITLRLTPLDDIPRLSLTIPSKGKIRARINGEQHIRAVVEAKGSLIGKENEPCSLHAFINMYRESATAQVKSVTPSTSAQTVLPDSGYDYLSQVNVGAIPYVETPNAYGTTVTIG